MNQLLLKPHTAVLGKLLLAGILLHVLYGVILYFTGSEFMSFWKTDDGTLGPVLSRSVPDTESYLQSADNFLSNGVFGWDQTPDYHRTIGYPAMIVLFKWLFGSCWYCVLVIFQMLFSALVYPAIFIIALIVNHQHKRVAVAAAIVVMFLGAFFTRTIFVASDVICATFFLCGVCCSLLSVVHGRKIYFIVTGILLLTIAALIRPVLILYPILHFLLLCHTARVSGQWQLRTVKRIIIFSSILLVVLCNISSVRVFLYYGTFTPTDILGINEFEYSTKHILESKGKTAVYESMYAAVNAKTDWREQSSMRSDYFFETIGNYPVAAVSYWASSAVSHLISPHIMETGLMYGYYKKEMNTNGIHRKKSVLMAVLFYAMLFVNLLLIVVPFTLFWWGLILRKRDFLLAFLLLFMVGSFFVPTLLAGTSSRMRMLFEPFMVIFALQYLLTKWPLVLAVWKNARGAK